MPQFLVFIACMVFISLPLKALEEIDNKPHVSEKVYIYVYHLKPPYIEQLELETGLYFELVQLFNNYQTEFQFVPQFVPRKRLNREIANSTLDGMILGVHPIWFKDKTQTKFLWTPPILHDQDEFISHVNNTFDYLGPVSLYNKNIGGVRGYHYFRVAPILKMGKAKLTPTGSELQLLEMLIKERLDLAVISRATLNYYFAIHPEWQSKIHYSKTPHEQYYRAILSPKSLEKPFNIIKKLMENEEFKSALNGLKLKYSFQEKPVVHK